jgi:preprotein translocase subunit SecG
VHGIICPLGEARFDIAFILFRIWRSVVKVALDIALIITSIALIASIILQSKGAGLGGLTGGDSGGIFTARRGVEKVLFRVTIGLSFLFFFLAILSVIITG